MYIVALFHNKRRKNSFFLWVLRAIWVNKTPEVGLILGFGAARKSLLISFSSYCQQITHVELQILQIINK